MDKITAIYMRVSTSQQTTRSQKPDLQRWVNAQDPDSLGEVKWYHDSATGKNMDRPGWLKLQASIDTGEVNRLVIWRLDRLGRTASGLCKLFEDLQDKKVRLVSLKDSIDLGTPSGRLIANVLASVAAYETEVRGERVKAGQQAARETGKKWGGSKKGRRIKVTQDQVNAILEMKGKGKKIASIARTVCLSRLTIYRILEQES
jgi:DNA invertase Pin-like site-specific DNA recombinase